MHVGTRLRHQMIEYAWRDGSTTPEDKICAERRNYDSKKLNMPIAVIIGSEGDGVKKSIKERCDGVLTLPLKGKVNSLNASVACGIVIFEILRQREN